MRASPIASVLRAIPGPDEAVTPSAPPNDPPMAEQTAAISSSAWQVVISKRRNFDSSWRMSEAGVIGYEPKKSRTPAFCPAATRPSAAALEVLEVYFQSRRVHGDERVGLIARREHLVRGELDLVARDARGSPGRRADFRGIVGESREIVAVHRGFARELGAGQLHAVA